MGYVAYIAIGMAAIGAGVFGRNEEGDSQVKERINKVWLNNSSKQVVS